MGVRAPAVVAAQAQQSVPSTPVRLAAMRHHFAQVLAIHDAVIRGDLAAVRPPARELATIAIPPGISMDASPFVVAIRLAGQRATAATTIASAASATVSMVGECANCHRAVGIFPAPSVPGTPDIGGVVGHMLEHQRAVDDLLLGLLVPSASQWRQGAERLRTALLRPAQLPTDKKSIEAMRRAETRVHEVADQAADAETAPARAAAYVQLLTGCAECHSLNRTWGPK